MEDPQLPSGTLHESWTAYGLYYRRVRKQVIFLENVLQKGDHRRGRRHPRVARVECSLPLVALARRLPNSGEMIPRLCHYTLYLFFADHPPRKQQGEYDGSGEETMVCTYGRVGEDVACSACGRRRVHPRSRISGCELRGSRVTPLLPHGAFLSIDGVRVRFRQCPAAYAQRTQGLRVCPIRRHRASASRGAACGRPAGSRHV